MKSLRHLQTMPNRQQLLLRYAKNCRLELAKRGIETSRYDWEKLARREHHDAAPGVDGTTQITNQLNLFAY
jgi:hypothetical protein